MTTTAQETVQGALASIVATARIENAQAEVAHAEDNARLARERFAEQSEKFTKAIRDGLGYTGIVKPFEQVEGTPDYEIVFAATIIEGLVFAYRKPNLGSWWGHDMDDRRLCVLRECEKGCGKPVYVGINSANDLAYALEQPHEHGWDCTGERNKPATAQPTLGDRIVSIEALLDEIEQAALASGTAHAIVQQLEDERSLLKASCIAEMIGTPNPLGKPGAMHSASSAEAVVEQHEKYWQHRQKQATAEVEKWKCLGQWHAARLRAELHVGLAKAGAL